MNLPDTLKRLAELLPERVFPDDGDYRVKLWNSRERILMANSYGLMVLEQGMRLEIEARGWSWELAGPGATATVWRVGDSPEHCHVRLDPTPAHALALALIAALEAEAQS